MKSSFDGHPRSERVRTGGHALQWNAGRGLVLVLTFLVSFLFALVFIGIFETSQLLSVRFFFFGTHSSMKLCVQASVARRKANNSAGVRDS